MTTLTHNLEHVLNGNAEYTKKKKLAEQMIERDPYILKKRIFDMTDAEAKKEYEKII